MVDAVPTAIDVRRNSSISSHVEGVQSCSITKVGIEPSTPQPLYKCTRQPRRTIMWIFKTINKCIHACIHIRHTFINIAVNLDISFPLHQHYNSITTTTLRTLLLFQTSPLILFSLGISSSSTTTYTIPWVVPSLIFSL